MLALNMLAPTLTSRVTEHVPVIIQFIQGIMDRGHAYVGSDGRNLLLWISTVCRNLIGVMTYMSLPENICL